MLLCVPYKSFYAIPYPLLFFYPEFLLLIFLRLFSPSKLHAFLGVSLNFRVISTPLSCFIIPFYRRNSKLFGFFHQALHRRAFLNKLYRTIGCAAPRATTKFACLSVPSITLYSKIGKEFSLMEKVFQPEYTNDTYS